MTLEPVLYQLPEPGKAVAAPDAGDNLITQQQVLALSTSGQTLGRSMKILVILKDTPVSFV